MIINCHRQWLSPQLMGLTAKPADGPRRRHLDPAETRNVPPGTNLTAYFAWRACTWSTASVLTASIAML